MMFPRAVFITEQLSQNLYELSRQLQLIIQIKEKGLMPMRRTAIVCALVGVIFAAGCGRIGTKLKNHIELVGTSLTETAVTVADVNVRAARGAIEIKDFRVANPDGYVAQNAMSVERAYLNVGLVSTVAGEPLVVDRLILSYPVLNLEQNRGGGSNLKDIADNVEKNRQQADQKSADYQPASEETPSEPLRIRIKELVIEGVTLNVLRVDGSSASAILPTIKLENVGGEKGVTPAELGLVIAGAMTGELLKEMIARELIQHAGDIKQALSAENLMKALDHTLKLNPEVQQKIVPFVEELSRGLSATIDVWVEQGYIDLAELNAQLAPVLDRFEQGLADHLDSGQFELLKAKLENIRTNGLEVLRHLAINQVAGYLEITPDQLVQLRPVLHEHFVRISAVIKTVSEDPERSKQTLIAAYDEAAEQLQSSLSPILSPQQMERIDLWLDEVLEKILLLADRFLE